MSHFQNKSDARAHFKSILKSIDAETRRAHSHRAAELLAQTPEFQSADVVMIFLSMEDEIDTCQVALLAWEANKTVVAPHIAWNARKLTPVELRSLSDAESNAGQSWKDHPFDGKPMPIEEVDLVLVPALAYSKDGHRLGRGLGFYDRFLTEFNFRGTSCGFGFDFQLADSLPIEAHDARLKMLVTEGRVLRL